MNRRKIGTEKERLAEAFLEKHGVHILARNYRTRIGEIDLIGQKCGVLIFFEVKYRRAADYGFPEEAVNAMKQRTICRVSDCYRMTLHHGCHTVRYDVVAILGNDIHWIKNAFDYQGNGW